MDASDPSRHPVRRRSYAVYTVAIEHLFKTIFSWVDAGVTGGYLYAVTRTGKTSALLYWAESLCRQRYDKRLVLVRAIYKRRNRPSEANFLSMLARACGHDFVGTGKVDDLEFRIGNYLVVRSREAGMRHVLLIIDEGQSMGALEYAVLCNIQNYLEEHQVRVTVVAIGTQVLTYQHEAFALGDDAELAARFMVRSARFRGVESEEHLRYALQGYDESQWPVGSGIPYTRHFLPIAFDAGFRLAGLAESLWAEFTSQAPPTLLKRLEVGMEYVGKSAEWLLENPGDKASLAEHVSEALIRQAVDQTQYRLHMRSVARILHRVSQ